MKSIIKALPLVVFATVAGMQTAQASYECNAPKTKYKDVMCTSDEALFKAYSGDSSVLINKNGKVLAKLSKYDNVDTSSASEGIIPVIKNGKLGYINYFGKLVIPMIYDSLEDDDDKYNETVANGASNGAITVKKNGKYGVINTKGKVLVPFSSKYETIEGYSEGRATFQSAKSRLWGVLDSNGKVVVSPKYSNIYGTMGGYAGYSQGLLPVSKNEKWGYITKTGKVAIPFVYDDVRSFSEGYAGVRKGKYWGFIDGANKTKIPFKYADSKVTKLSVNYFGAGFFIFDDGQAQVASKNDDSSICINKSGNKTTCRW